MNRTFEARLAKVEAAIVPKRMSHEDWLGILDSQPPRTTAECAAMDEETDTIAIAQFGSLAAAARAARQKADHTRDPLDGFIAEDLECRAGMEVDHAFA